MKDDTISRQAAIAEFSCCQLTPDGGIDVNYAIDFLKQLPSAQPERKKGEWIYYPKASGSVTSTAVHLYPVCSECGCEHPIANFCPNCGARMEVEE